MKDRLIWLQQQLQRLTDNYAIPSQWEADYAGIKNELADVINTYVDAVAPPPAVVQHVMTGDELAALAGTITSGVGTMLQIATGALKEEVQSSDVTILAAIAETRAELLAGLPPLTTA